MRAVAIPSMSDRPFGVPLDIVLDIPVPPSVNRTRKINWREHKKYEKWRFDAGFHLVANGQFRAIKNLRLTRYELTVTLDEKQCKLDPDNPIKAASDLLKYLGAIVDDAPRHARRITVEWGHAPDGCRLTLRRAA
jgi:hypothetical protein